MTKLAILATLTNFILPTSFFELYHSNFGGSITTIICAYRSFQTSIFFTFGALSHRQNITGPETPPQQLSQIKHPNSNRVKAITSNRVCIYSLHSSIFLKPVRANLGTIGNVLRPTSLLICRGLSNRFQRKVQDPSVKTGKNTANYNFSGFVHNL